MNKYISVNIVSQSLMLIGYIRKNNCISTHEIMQLKLPIFIDRNVSLDFAIQCKWLIRSNETIIFSNTGNEILDRFDGVAIDRELWKIILHRYISVCQPAWAKRIPYGRKEAYLFMNEEEQRCFLEADLIDCYDKDVIEWWDSIAKVERVKNEDLLGEIGRKGESLTIRYEELRTGVVPEWRSIESNLAGYDILSQRSLDNHEKILIEVKTSQQSFDNACLIISRHEWDIASVGNNLHKYYFYLWDLSKTIQKLAIISAEEMSFQIPNDNNYGIWETARIPFNVFSEKFKTVCFD